MDRTSKILLLLVFLALTANLFQPLFFPRQARADEVYQVAVLSSTFRVAIRKLEAQINEVYQKFEKHTHKLKVCACDSDDAKVTVETSKAE